MFCSKYDGSRAKGTYSFGFGAWGGNRFYQQLKLDAVCIGDRIGNMTYDKQR